MSPLLEFASVSKTYRRGRQMVQALRDVSFSVADGEVFGFVGPNGAGKSTTIKILFDVISNYEGEVRLFGRSARDASTRKQVAYVPESPSLYEQFTPLEILRMGISMHRVRHTNIDQYCLEWLDRFSVQEVAHRRIRQLSKGTVQRVALAHALAVLPRLLVLDEPLSGLDPVGRKNVTDILAEFKHQGGAIFFTSHVLHDVERLADRFGLIHKGELRAVRSPSELIESDDHVVVRSQGITPVGCMTRESGNRWVAEIERTNLWALLHLLETADHSVLEIKPTLSLEKAFMEIVRAR